ncbi:HAD-IA family hydrolase [Fulvivirgaceae bacterium BMA10]|uniref:HAD-IA family hydrolase n=1 Tax=Splendidivirga corallicola TaxID=3051826 RepID=A0ABT8KUC6_9BACT|nr:HAD-IA family hydrolase [Fulvivirgaceae bacterium BMA10]
MANIDNILFDCDGVLVDTEIVAARVMVEQLQSLDIDINVGTYLTECTGRTFSGIFRDFMDKGQLDPELKLDEIIASLEQRIFEGTTPIIGVNQALDQIQIRKSVVSNSNVYQIQHALESAGISKHFGSRMFSSMHVEKPKPSPLVYLYALKSLRVPKERCIVIEDSLSGTKAAKSAGMTVIGFTGGSHIVDGHKEKLEALGVLTVCEKHEDLPDLISDITKSS